MFVHKLLDYRKNLLTSFQDVARLTILNC